MGGDAGRRRVVTGRRVCAEEFAVDGGRSGIVRTPPHTMRTIVGDALVHHIMVRHPVIHAANVVRVIRISEQPPLRKGELFSVHRGELRLIPQTQRFADIPGERRILGLVITVGADDVDDVVPRIALGPRHRVPAARGGEVEPERRARNRPHGRHDPPPVRLPRRRVRPAPAAVGGTVHLPAQDQHGVADPLRDQAFRQRPEVPVVGAGRAVAQHRGHHRVGHAHLVRREHRNVQHQQPPRDGLPPRRPRPQQPDRPLDARPHLTGQVGAADGDRGAEPAFELLDLPDAFRTGTQKYAERDIPPFSTVRFRRCSRVSRCRIGGCSEHRSRCGPVGDPPGGTGTGTGRGHRRDRQGHDHRQARHRPAERRQRRSRTPMADRPPSTMVTA